MGDCHGVESFRTREECAMDSKLFTRRDFSARLAALVPGLAVAGTVPRLNRGANEVTTRQDDGGITHASDAIHQEVTFKASSARVYAVLTDAALFDKVVHQSDAMKGGMPPGAPPASISRVAGGAFTLFGGYVTGRQIELVPNQRVVQAWRSGSWKAGMYSIAKFELTDQGASCKLVFDHAGFPAGEAQHLADGWKVNYWRPMAKVLA
jgi:activator of HSP90 ATPase